MNCRVAAWSFAGDQVGLLLRKTFSGEHSTGERRSILLLANAANALRDLMVVRRAVPLLQAQPVAVDLPVILGGKPGRLFLAGIPVIHRSWWQVDPAAVTWLKQWVVIHYHVEPGNSQNIAITEVKSVQYDAQRPAVWPSVADKKNQLT